MHSVAEVIAATGVTRKAIRVYEQKGLLPPAPRTAAGYRQFSDSDIDILRFIRSARSLGLGLDDISEILDVHYDGTAPCTVTAELLRERIGKIDTVLDDLTRLRGKMTLALDRAADDRAAAPVCGIIETNLDIP